MCENLNIFFYMGYFILGYLICWVINSCENDESRKSGPTCEKCNKEIHHEDSFDWICTECGGNNRRK